MKVSLNKVAACIVAIGLALVLCACSSARTATSNSTGTVSASLSKDIASSAITGHQASVSGNLTVRYIDVGQGDAAIVSCDGHHLLIDGGPSDQSSKIYTILKNLGITEFDVVIATHPDADHIGGISGALNTASTSRCYCSVTQADTKTFASMAKYLDSHGAKLQVPKAGDSFELGGARVTFVGPVKRLEGDNNNSLVVRLDYGSTSFLFMGDAEYDEESSLLSSNANLDATVLKVAHHGSSSSSSSSFLKCVSPAFVVVSVGANSYGHPTQQTLSRLEATGASILRTDQLSSIVVTSDGNKLGVTWGKTVVPDMGSNKSVEELKSATAAALVAPGDASASDGKKEGSQNEAVSQSYVLNTNSKKFHYPNCSAVSKMKDKNKQIFEGARDQVIAMGYSPCGICRP